MQEQEASVLPGSVSTGRRPASCRRRWLTHAGLPSVWRRAGPGLPPASPVARARQAQGLPSPVVPDSGDGGRVIAGKGNGEGGQPPKQENTCQRLPGDSPFPADGHSCVTWTEF